MSKIFLRPIILIAVLCLIACSWSVIADEPATAPVGNPALAQFNQDITFYASFDHHATADLSSGKGEPTGNAQGLEWSAGIWGQALQGRNNSLIYDAKDNVDLSHAGSLIMWVTPSGVWTDAAAPIQLSLASIHDQGESLLLARQGGKSNGQALMAIYGPDANDAKSRALIHNSNTLDWKQGEWHLLAVNWAKGYVELSVDGNLFQKGTSLSDGAPTANTIESLALAGRSTPQSPYLMDEVMILNRPLTNDEVKEIFQQKNDSKS